MLAENPPLGGASEVSSAPFARIQSRLKGTPDGVPFGCTNPAARDGDGVVFPTDIDSGAGRADGAGLQLEGLVAVMMSPHSCREKGDPSTSVENSSSTAILSPTIMSCQSLIPGGRGSRS